MVDLYLGIAETIRRLHIFPTNLSYRKLLPDSSLLVLIIAATFLQSLLYADKSPDTLPAISPAKTFKFDRLSLEDGLSQSTIMAIHQDQQGFMWFGTQDGLNRYDGYEFKVYKHDPRDPYSISGDLIQSISEDRAGNLWIGTQAGLDRFDPIREQFTPVQLDAVEESSIEKGGPISVFEDSEGMVWIRKRAGVVRLDPVSGKSYEPAEDTVHPLGFNRGYFATDIIEDQRGFVWIGTFPEADSIAGGLFRFDLKSGEFTHYQHDPENKYSLGSNRVSVIYPDHSGGLWIGTMGGGLNGLDVETGQFVRYQSDPEARTTLGSNNITAILQTASGNMWIGTELGGLSHFCRPKGVFTNYKIPERIAKGRWQNSVSFNFRNPNHGSLLEDSDGRLWVRNGYEELLVFDTAKRSFKLLRSNRLDTGTLPSNRVSALYQDRLSNIWVGSDMAGLAKYSHGKEKFMKYGPAAADGTGLRSGVIWAISSDNKNNIWVGSSGGLDRIDAVSGQIVPRHKTALLTGGTTNMLVRAITTDHAGDLWFGAGNRGLEHWNYKTGKITRYPHSSSDPYSLSSNGILAIHEPHSSLGRELWVGTGGSGLNLLNRKTGKFRRYRHNPADSLSLSNNGVRAILEDSEGTLWVGTVKGLNRMDADRKHFKRFLHDPANIYGLSNDRIMSIHEDRYGNLWIGTYGGGLNHFDRKTETFTHYREQDGLPNNVIYGILSDSKGHLWLSTNRGIAQFTIPAELREADFQGAVLRNSSDTKPSKPFIRNFTMADGLQSFEFNQGAFHLSRNGEMFFGGINGINRFNPASLEEASRYSPILLTSFKRQNEPLNLHRLLAEKPVIELSHNDNIFSFGFVMLDYANPGRNQYAYRLRGFKDEWIYIGNRREAQLMNLEPGRYIFDVKGQNYEGVWTPKPASVAIIIHPPFWKTWWFRALVALTVLGLIWLFYRLRVRKIEQQKVELEKLVTVRTRELRREKEAAEHAKQTIEAQARVLEKQKERAEQDKATIEKQTRRLMEMDRIKSRFFANISHEFRTPLTLIMSPLEELLSADYQDKSNISAGLARTLSGIQRNSHRLLRLINQLLDLSKMESGNMQPKPSPGNITDFAGRIVQSFAGAAARKEIDLGFTSTIAHPEVQFDHDKLEKILYNLISNAIKFTPDNGRISVDLALFQRNGTLPMQDWLEIRVADTGIGIAEEQIPKIFERFFQVDASSIREYTGSGIGLALTSELVEVLDGSIEVKSTVGEGSTFIVQLPAGAAQKVDPSVSNNGESPQLFAQTASPLEDDLVAQNGKNGNGSNEVSEDALPVVLVVEDNREVHDYICEQLSADYTVLSAYDGREGLEQAFDVIPDLIVSDIMMPAINGYQLCEQLKNDSRTSHIPIIILTARASDESKLEGLETGADAYIIKPFSPKELRLRIAKLLEQRRKLRDQFSKQVYLQPRDIVVNSMDETFLNRVCEIIESHMDDCELSIEALGQEIGMSRPHFHKKIRALTGQSPSQFVRSMRLRRAAQLLEQQSGTVTEVAHDVGFNNLSYFTKCFREQFGVLPSEFGK